MSAVAVPLAPGEVMFAAFVGVARTVSALRDGRTLEAGRLDDGWERSVHGAIGEYAVAKTLDVHWHPAVGRLDTLTGDVGGYQVKATTRSDGCLIVRPHDPPEFVYLLVVIDRSTVAVVGSKLGYEAKVPRYWRERDVARGIHRAAYFVPQSDLEAVEL